MTTERHRVYRCVLFVVWPALLMPLPCRGDDPPQIAKRSEAARVRALVRLHLTSGQRVPYRAEQTIRLLEGRVVEATQIVLRGGRDRERIEYLSPPHLRGEVILRVGQRLLHFRPRPDPHVIESSAPEETADLRLRGLLASIRDGSVKLERIGEQMVAGRQAEIVEIRPAGTGPVRRLWIDRETGVRLRHESVDARGVVTATAYFTSIAYNPPFRASDFSPEALAQLARTTKLPGAVRTASIEAAQGQVPFRIRVPDLPPAFTLSEVWLVGPHNNRGVALFYTDGVNTVRVSQRRVPARSARAGLEEAARWPVIRPGFAYWLRGDILYTIAGPVRAPMLQRAMRSLR